MKTNHTSFRETVSSFFKHGLVIPILAVLGCASAPNLLPVGAPELLLYPGVRRIAGATDYPVVVTTAKDDKKVEIRWAWRGKRLWGKTPFSTANAVQFTLRQPGGETLCSLPEVKNTGNPDDTVTCEFDVAKYTSEPLVGELTYWFGDERGDENLPDRVMRTYYLIQQPKE